MTKAEEKINDYKSRLAREKKVLERLTTPVKKNQKRPVSANKPKMNTAPNHKYESKIDARDRHTMSEKKRHDYDQLVYQGMNFDEWRQRKTTEKRLKAFLINAEKSKIK